MRNILYTPTNSRYNLLNDLDSLLLERPRSVQSRGPKPVFREEEEAYYAAFNLPGLSKDVVTISVLENTLKIVAKSGEDAAFKVDYNKSYLLPEDANNEEIAACLEHGVLSVTVPKVKQQELKERVIPLTDAS